MVRSLQSFLLLRCFRYLFWIFRPLCTCWKVSNIGNKSLYLDACTLLNSIELISSMYGCSDNFTILLQQYLFNLISQLMLFCHCLWIIFHGVYSIWIFNMNFLWISKSSLRCYIQSKNQNEEKFNVRRMYQELYWILYFNIHGRTIFVQSVFYVIVHTTRAVLPSRKGAIFFSLSGLLP